MAVETCSDPKTGQVFFKVKVVVKSKSVPGLKIQKQESRIETEPQAKRRYQELRDEAVRELVEREAQGELWGNLIEKWSVALHTGEGLERPVTVNTAEDYVGTISTYTKDWWKKPASTITRHDIKMALESVTKSGRSDSRKKYLKIALCRAFQWGIDTRHVKGLHDNPVRGIPIGKIVERQPGILSTTEAKLLLQSAKRLNHPWYPIWAFALLTGLRSGELHALEWTDVDLDNKLLNINKSYNGRMKKVKCTKSGCWRTVPISPELESLLRDLKLSAAGRKQVLPRFIDWDSGNQASILRQFCIGLGITPVKFHDLRACFATFLLRDGVPAAQVMKICGWKDLKTMQRYVRLAAIEVRGVTDGLKLLPDSEVMGRVINLMPREG